MDYNYLAELLFPDVTETPEDMEKRFPKRELPDGAVVSRMAPSPTGFVHLGNLMQGLTSERLAHQSGGIMYLRVEDTDAKREVKGATETLIEMLSHYGIFFDEGAALDENGKIYDKGIYGPYKQSMRASIYHVYAKKLVKEGKAYPCFCTEEELERFHAEQEAEKANFGYYGKWAKWRDRPIEDIEAELKAGKEWVLRFRSTGSIEHKFKYHDLIKGDVDITDIQLFAALGHKLPKYVHIGTLMKMDGNSKRKLSKRKDPELALSYYKSEGYPTESVVEYIMTILNSNFEDWRRANPDAPLGDFKFTTKKMNAAGSLFDLAKLCDVSKNIISRWSAEKVYEETAEWAKEFDSEFYGEFTANPDFTKAVLAIGRGGNKPRKDFAVWSEVKGYMGFMFDKYYNAEGEYPQGFEPALIADVLKAYLAAYSPEDDQSAWFDKMKDVAEKFGFAREMKEYKANPEAYKGSIGDISSFVRVAITGKQNAPDLYTVMNILGENKSRERIEKQIERLGG